MGPLAGIGDSLVVGTLIPILLGIALGLSNRWICRRTDLLYRSMELDHGIWNEVLILQRI